MRGRSRIQINGATMLFTLAAAMLFVFGVAGMALAALGTYGLVSYMVQTKHARDRDPDRARGAAAFPRPAVSGARAQTRRHRRGNRHRDGARGDADARACCSGVSATDPASFARALAIVMSVVVVATLVPAWRASRMKPAERAPASVAVSSSEDTMTDSTSGTSTGSIE